MRADEVMQREPATIAGVEKGSTRRPTPWFNRAQERRDLTVCNSENRTFLRPPQGKWRWSGSRHTFACALAVSNTSGRTGAPARPDA